MANSEENQKKWAQIVAKAWMDEEVKQSLIADPQAVLAENGISLEGAPACRVVEAAQGEICFILPAKPEGSMSEEELKDIAAAGGATPFCGTKCW